MNDSEFIYKPGSRNLKTMSYSTLPTSIPHELPLFSLEEPNEPITLSWYPQEKPPCTLSPITSHVIWHGGLTTTMDCVPLLQCSTMLVAKSATAMFYFSLRLQAEATTGDQVIS